MQTYFVVDNILQFHSANTFDCATERLTRNSCRGISTRYFRIIRPFVGNILQIGNEQVRMCEGRLWQFENKQHHSSCNDSDE
jgi:hypothetical protein